MRAIEPRRLVQDGDIEDYWIIDFNRPVANLRVSEVIGGFNRILSGLSCIEVIDISDRDYPERDDFPKWKHVGAHIETGRLFWDHLNHHHPEWSLCFGDAPDFSGKMGEYRFWGDIGQVSPTAFIFTLQNMRLGDMWMTVQGDCTKLIIIMALADIGAFAGQLEGHCNPEPLKPFIKKGFDANPYGPFWTSECEYENGFIVNFVDGDPPIPQGTH